MSFLIRTPHLLRYQPVGMDKVELIDTEKLILTLECVKAALIHSTKGSKMTTLSGQQNHYLLISAFQSCNTPV